MRLAAKRVGRIRNTSALAEIAQAAAESGPRRYSSSNEAWKFFVFDPLLVLQVINQSL
jgi:hypothetical protein